MNAPTTFPKTVQPRDGDHVLVTVPNHWGRAPTLAEARKACERAAGRKIGQRWRVYSCHPETYLDDMGYIIVPKGAQAPKVLAELNPS